MSDRLTEAYNAGVARREAEEAAESERREIERRRESLEERDEWAAAVRSHLVAQTDPERLRAIAESGTTYVLIGTDLTGCTIPDPETGERKWLRGMYIDREFIIEVGHSAALRRAGELRYQGCNAYAVKISHPPTPGYSTPEGPKVGSGAPGYLEYGVAVIWGPRALPFEDEAYTDMRLPRLIDPRWEGDEAVSVAAIRE